MLTKITQEEINHFKNNTANSSQEEFLEIDIFGIDLKIPYSSMFKDISNTNIYLANSIQDIFDNFDYLVNQTSEKQKTQESSELEKIFQKTFQEKKIQI